MLVAVDPTDEAAPAGRMRPILGTGDLRGRTASWLYECAHEPSVEHFLAT